MTSKCEEGGIEVGTVAASCGGTPLSFSRSGSCVGAEGEIEVGAAIAACCGGCPSLVLWHWLMR